MLNLTVLAIVGLAIVSVQVTTVVSLCASTGTGCLSATSSCQGRANGDYQACEGCTFYHSCSGGYMYPNRPCAQTNQGGIGGRLVWTAWSANQGICDYSSSTCRECVTDANQGCTTDRTGSNCIRASTSCVGLADGDYQACESCTVYHSCSGGVNWSNRPCPITNYGGLRGRLVWNSWTANRGICDYTSSTCNECNPPVTPAPIIPTPAPIVPTAAPIIPVTQTPAPLPITCNSGSRSGTQCIRQAATSCVGKPDGDYQACEGCTFYHTCSNGLISANRPCARRSVFDNSLLVWVTESVGRGHCDWSSATCSCP